MADARRQQLAARVRAAMTTGQRDSMLMGLTRASAAINQLGAGTEDKMERFVYHQILAFIETVANDLTTKGSRA